MVRIGYLCAPKKTKGGGKTGAGRNVGGNGGGRNGDGTDQAAKPKCDVCKKPGHSKDACWVNPQSSNFKGEDFRQKVLKSLKSLDVEGPVVRLKNLEGLFLGCMGCEFGDCGAEGPGPDDIYIIDWTSDL